MRAVTNSLSICPVIMDLINTECLRMNNGETPELFKLEPVDFSLADVIEDEVTYKLFKHTDPDTPIVLSTELVNGIDIDTSLPTKLFLHGWTTSDATSPWYRLLKDAYFHKGFHNIFYIDWSSAGNKTYPVSAANVKLVGQHIAEFLVATKIPPENIHIVGHSLGSQLASFIGKSMQHLTGSKLARITALDPAGPKFEHPDYLPCLRLNPDDAEFVDVVHTDVAHFGFVTPTGHVDFYPNYGVDQPGCPSLTVDDNCSHARSTLYFIESVLIRNASAHEMSIKGTMPNIRFELVPNGKQVIFGDNVSIKARGTYYIKTNAKEPFLINSL